MSTSWCVKTLLVSSLVCLAFEVSAGGVESDSQEPSAAQEPAAAKKPPAVQSLRLEQEAASKPSASPEREVQTEVPIARDINLPTDTKKPAIPLENASPNTEGSGADSYVSKLDTLSIDANTSERADNGCKREREGDMWVDAVRASTHSRLCNTASWLDGLFGDSEEFAGQDFRGKVSIGFKHDEIEGIDPRLRVRIRTKLPNVSKRFDAFIGRVEEDSYISNTEVKDDRVSNVGLRSTNDEDSEWLVGLGYRTPSRESNGWDLSAGAKLSSGFNPYAKIAHRHLFPINDVSYFRTVQTVFWRKEDGYGVSSRADYTRQIGQDNIWTTRSDIKYTEEEEQWEWFGETTWHHSISDKRGVSSSLYARGEEENSIPEYGVTFTYIRPILRDWLYLETGVDFRWERDRPDIPYRSAVRFGIQFDMLLGDYYKRRRQHK